MSSQQRSVKRSLCGLGNEVVCSLAAPSRLRRTVSDGTAATFPYRDAKERWRLWRYGNDLGNERRAIGDICQRLTPDDVVWDVGANVGLYTAFVAQHAPTVAFEPGDETRARLRDTVRHNELTEAVTIRPIALGEADSAGRLTDDDTVVSGGDIPVRRGDTVVQNGTPAPTVLKVDVEGAEPAVLRGLGDEIDNVRLVYVEPHPPADTGPEVLTTLLETLGFQTATVPTTCRNDIIRGIRG